jgi:hypothetical protein
MKTKHEIYFDKEKTKPVTDYEVNEDGYAILNTGTFYIFGFTEVLALNEARVFAYDCSTVHAHDNSNIFAHDQSNVYAYDKSCIVATHESFVKAYGNSCVNAEGHSNVVPLGNSKVYGYQNSIIHVHGDGTPTVFITDNSTIRATSDVWEKAIYEKKSYPENYTKFTLNQS